MTTFPKDWIPESASLTPRAESMASWDSIPDSEKPFQRHLMEIFAGFSGGLTCYMKERYLCYEFNLFEIARTKIRSKERLPIGKVKIEVESRLAAKIGGPMDITLRVNGIEIAKDRVPAAMSLHFTCNATFDIGRDLDSPVSLDYYDDAPFAFNGTIDTTKIIYLK